MRTWSSVIFCLLLVVCLPGLDVYASRDANPPPQQSSPLTQAADEFKTLTRDLGMRPDSPPTAEEHHGPKMRWHGRVYENFRNDVLDAIPHEVKQNDESVSPLRRNQFGFNISGPLVLPHLLKKSDKTFFMLSYEGVRERISRANLLTVPTVQQRQGDFSETVDPSGDILPIYDPNQTSPNPVYDPTQAVSTTNLQYLRAQFLNNVIPQNRLSNTAQQALALYPVPNTDVGPFFQNNYFINSPQIDDADGFIAKLDHPFRERHRITFNSTVSSGYLSPAKYFPNDASPTSPDQHFSTLHTNLNYVYTPSGNTVNSATVAMNSNTVQSGEAGETPFPSYSLSNYVSMGTAFPNSRDARVTLELTDALSKQKGKNSIHLTGDVAFNQVNSFNPLYPSGYYQFTPDITSLPGIVDTGDPFASFLLGLTASAQQTVITSPSYFRDSYQGFTAGDRYAMRKNLTFSANLTLSRRTPRVEKYNRQSTVDPNLIDPSDGLPGALAFAGQDGIPRGLRPVNWDLDPSVGLTWNPRGSSKTVVSASYSRSHSQIPIYNGQWATQGFNAFESFISPNIQLSSAVGLDAGIPPLTSPLPDLSPSAADNTTADYMNMGKDEPVYQSVSLSIEHDIPFSIALSFGGNHSVGRDILVGDGTVNPNAIPAADMVYGDNLYDYSFRSTLQPYPQYLGFELYWIDPAGRYERDSSFIRVEKHASFGLTFTAYYEISKQMDDYSGPYGNQDFFNLRNDWSESPNNTPQYVQLSYVYEFPFGPNKPFMNYSGIAGALARGWSLSGNAYWNDGTPLAPHPEFNNTGDILSTLNVNVTPGISPHIPNPGPAEWFNPAAFGQPADFTEGNASRTVAGLLGPGYNSMDISFGKRLPIGGERTMEFNATALDVLNHANWNYPDTGIGSVSEPNVDAGRIIGSHGGRVIQLGMKITF